MNTQYSEPSNDGLFFPNTENTSEKLEQSTKVKIHIFLLITLLFLAMVILFVSMVFIIPGVTSSYQGFTAPTIEETTCTTVNITKIEERDSEKRYTYLVDYLVSNEKYRENTKDDTVDHYEIGEKFKCYYNVEDPKIVRTFRIVSGIFFHTIAFFYYLVALVAFFGVTVSALVYLLFLGFLIKLITRTPSVKE
eukprot:gene5641-9457_t